MSLIFTSIVFIDQDVLKRDQGDCRRGNLKGNSENPDSDAHFGRFRCSGGTLELNGNQPNIVERISETRMAWPIINRSHFYW